MLKGGSGSEGHHGKDSKPSVVYLITQQQSGGGGGQLSGALVCEPPSWPDKFPRDSERNETRTAHVGLDGKMNRPLRKVVKIDLCPVSQVERAGRTERKQSDQGDFAD